MEKFQVYFKDTDPDTGLLSQVKKMCECEEERLALCIKEALASQDCDDPNREYYVCSTAPKGEHLIVCASPEQIGLMSSFQNWCADRGVRCIVCFGEEDLASFRRIFDELGMKYMLAILSDSPAFEQVVGWELKMSQFEDEHDFDTVYSLLY